MEEQEFQNNHPEKETERREEDLFWHTPPYMPGYFYYPPINPNDPKEQQALAEILQQLEKNGYPARSAYLKWLHEGTLTCAYEELRNVAKTTDQALRKIQENKTLLQEKLIKLHEQWARLIKQQRERRNGTPPPTEAPKAQEKQEKSEPTTPPQPHDLPPTEPNQIDKTTPPLKSPEEPDKKRETLLQKELQDLDDEIQKKEQEIKEIQNKKEAQLREEIQERERELQEKQKELQQLKAERTEAEKAYAEALANSPLLPGRTKKGNKNFQTLEEAIWRWSPSQEALAGKLSIEPSDTPFQPFEDRAPWWLQGWRVLKGWVTHPLTRLATNLLGPIAAGVVLGINLSVLTGLVTIHEFRRGEKMWLFWLAIAIGIVAEALLGESWARAMSSLRRRGEPQGEIPRHQNPAPAKWGVFFPLVLVLLVVTVATVTVDAEGIKNLWEEMARLYIVDIGSRDAERPRWLFYIIGAVVSLPYLSFRALQGWTDPENRLRSAVLAHQEYLAIREIRSDPFVQETLRTGYILELLSERIQVTEQDIQSLKQNLRTLREKLHSPQEPPEHTQNGAPSYIAPNTTSTLDKPKAEPQRLKDRQAQTFAFQINPSPPNPFLSTPPPSENSPNAPTRQQKTGWLDRLLGRTPRENVPPYGTPLLPQTPDPELVAVDEQINLTRQQLEYLENEYKRHTARKDCARDTAIGTSQKFWGRVYEALELLEPFPKPYPRRPFSREVSFPRHPLRPPLWKRLWNVFTYPFRWLSSLFRRG